MNNRGKKLDRLVKIENRHPDTYQVTWIINSICSNSCSYCLPSLFAGTNHGYEWSNAKRFVEYILQTHKTSHWSISGGEPTMSPFFKEFVKMVYDAGSTVGMTSNGVKPAYYLVDIAQYMSYIAFSYHPEFSNDDELIEKILACNYFTNASVRVMLPANEPYWSKSVNFLKRLNRLQAITYESVKVLRYEDNSGPIAAETYNYSQDQLDFFENEIARGSMKVPNYLLDKNHIPIEANYYEKNGTIRTHPEVNAVDYINQGFSNFQGWKCYAGLESVFIGADGRIQTANCTNDPIIGWIDKPEEIKWPTKATICNLGICHCATDFILTKKPPKSQKILTQSII